MNKGNKLDADQKLEIDAGIAAGLDVSCYAKPEFMAIQMHQIRLGLEAGLDVSVYAIPEYDWFQMEEIREGMQEGVNYLLYASPAIAYDKMREIRKGLRDGIDLSGFANLNAGILKQLRKSIVAKVSIIDYINEGYVEEQLEEIRHALERGLPIRKYLSKEFRGVAIREIWKGLEDGIDPSVYVSIDYDWKQMREIRLGLEHQIDVSQYINSLFAWQQMREIRLGLEEGLDITPYRSFMYVAADMKRIREELSSGILEHIIKEYTDEKADNQKIAVYISSDEMEASIEIQCGREDFVSSDEILEALKKNGVKQGILKEDIEQLVKDRKYRVTVLAARGKRPVQGKDGWYEYFFNTEVDSSPKVLEDGSVDYTDVKSFETVENGQKIAFYHTAEYGTGGYTVTGRFLPSKKGKEQSVLTGRGFHSLTDGRTYVSLMAGKIQLMEDNRIEITRLCVLDEVTLATGNVDFEGSILVRGDVGSGVVIHATEDIIVNGFVESAKLSCGGDIFLRSGVHGAGAGIIEAGRKVAGNFFEYAQIVSGGDIEANYCLNCDLEAAEWILIHGVKGTLAGGTARAGKGVKSYNIGNRAKLPTVLRLGVNEDLIKSRQEAEFKISEVGRELVILENAYAGFQNKYAPEVRNAMDMYIKIENALYTKQLELDGYKNALKQYDLTAERMADARAVVKGSLYEGTTIYINDNKLYACSVRDVTVKSMQDRIVLEPN